MEENLASMIVHFCRGSKLRIERQFRALRRNTDAHGYHLAQMLINGQPSSIESGILRHRE